MHFEVDVERVVPIFFSSPQADAIFDFVACAPDDYERFYIHVSGSLGDVWHLERRRLGQGATGGRM